MLVVDKNTFKTEVLENEGYVLVDFPPFTGASIQTFSFPMSSPLNLPAPGRCQAVYFFFQIGTALCFC